MTLTVAICTWNRATLLRAALEALAAADRPEGVGWEVLVVDNGCTDDTRRVLADFAGGLPLRTALEPTPGLANARNRAVDEATGDHIVWIDDDVVVEPGWLRAYAAAFRDHPDAVLFGGPIRCRFLSPRPAWLEANWETLRGVYSERAAPVASDEITPDWLPFGANYAVRADAQRTVRYDARLGRKRTGLVGMEEISVMEALLAGGGRGRWVGAARVEHLVPADRLRPPYVFGVFAGHGYVEADRLPALGGPRPAGVPLALWKKWLTAELSYRLRPTGSDPEAWLGRLREAAVRRGQIRGLRERRKRPVSST